MGKEKGGKGLRIGRGTPVLAKITLLWIIKKTGGGRRITGRWRAFKVVSHGGVG